MYFINVNIRIKEWMDKNNLTTTKIFKDTGISKSNVSDWCKGNKLPSSKALIKLYETYNMPIGYILTGKELTMNHQFIIDIYNKLNEKNKLIALSDLKHIYEIQEITNENKGSD